MEPNVITVSTIDPKKEGLKMGLILGAVHLLITFGTYYAGESLHFKASYFNAFIPWMIVILLIAAFDLRKKNGGYLSFSQGLQFFFLAYVVAEVLTAIGTYVLYAVIDPELTRKAYEYAVSGMQEMMEKLGAKEEDIDKALSEAKEKAENQTSFKHVLLGIGLNLIWDFVKSMLLAVIVKKEQPLFQEPVNVRVVE